VSDHQLQEGEVAAARERQSRNGDEGDGGGLRGHDRSRDGPPRQLPPGQEIVARGLLPTAAPEADGHDRSEVRHDDEEVDGGQGGGYSWQLGVGRWEVADGKRVGEGG